MVKNQELMLFADYEFNLSDFALFLSVMKHKKAYQNTLSIVLDEEDLELKQVKVERVCHKLKKNKASEQIADELEEEMNLISAICRATEVAVLEYDSRPVYENWKRGD